MHSCSYKITLRFSMLNNGTHEKETKIDRYYNELCICITESHEKVCELLNSNSDKNKAIILIDALVSGLFIFVKTYNLHT